jgi:hypothetical protein
VSRLSSRRLRATFALFAGACLTACAQANSAPHALPSFAHYQPILDRMPFGSPPAHFGDAPVDQAALMTAAQEKAEQQALAKQVTMSAVNVTPGGATAVGFTDRAANPPVNHYLRVGESADGWTLKDADFDSEFATLEKDGVAITLKLGEGLVDAPPALLNAASSGVAAIPAAAKEAQSFSDRLHERTALRTQAEREAETRMRAQFEKLARETAIREIQRRQEEEALDEGDRAPPEHQEQPQ